MFLKLLKNKILYSSSFIYNINQAPQMFLMFIQIYINYLQIIKLNKSIIRILIIYNTLIV